MDLPSTPEALHQLDKPGVAQTLLVKARWPDGVVACPMCACSKVYWLARRERWKCGDCAWQFRVTGNTVFQGSQLELKVWLVAIWFLANAGEGELDLPTYPQIAQTLGVATTTAWYVFHKLRLALDLSSSKDDWSAASQEEERFLRALFRIVRAPREEVERSMPIYRKSYAKRAVWTYRAFTSSPDR